MKIAQSRLAADASTPRLHRAAVITPGVSYRGDGSTGVVRQVVEMDLLTILGTTCGHFADQATIVVDGVPVAAVVDQSRAIASAGWAHTTIAAWTLFHRDDRSVAVGLRASMVPRLHYGVLFNANTEPDMVAIMLDRYHQVTGTAWRGTPATTALAGVRLTWPNQRWQPLWTESGKGAGVGPLMWSRPLNRWEATWGWVHTFDANSAYLGTAISAELAWSGLAHTGPVLFDAKLPGYWLLRLDDATLAACRDRTRPPLLESRHIHEGCAWVSTPYARLLAELGDRCEVLDSRTAQRGARILRPWGETIRDGLATVAAMPSGGLRDTLLRAVKRTYTDAVGATQREYQGRGMRIHRAVWGHSIVDGWRATLYRRILAVKQSEGVWPVAVHTDSVSYADCSDDPAVLAKAIGVRNGLGGFKHTATVSTQQWEEDHVKAARASDRISRQRDAA